jgi:hypothetical protein
LWSRLGAAGTATVTVPPARAALPPARCTAGPARRAPPPARRARAGRLPRRSRVRHRPSHRSHGAPVHPPALPAGPGRSGQHRVGGAFGIPSRRSRRITNHSNPSRGSELAILRPARLGPRPRLGSRVSHHQSAGPAGSARTRLGAGQALGLGPGPELQLLGVQTRRAQVLVPQAPARPSAADGRISRSATASPSHSGRLGVSVTAEPPPLSTLRPGRPGCVQ